MVTMSWTDLVRGWGTGAAGVRFTQQHLRRGLRVDRSTGCRADTDRRTARFIDPSVCRRRQDYGSSRRGMAADTEVPCGVARLIMKVPPMDSIRRRMESIPIPLM